MNLWQNCGYKSIVLGEQGNLNVWNICRLSIITDKFWLSYNYNYYITAWLIKWSFNEEGDPTQCGLMCNIV